LYVLSQSVLQNVLAFKTIKLIDMIFALIDLSYQILWIYFYCVEYKLSTIIVHDKW
jgi:hypothetical protein